MGNKNLADVIVPLPLSSPLTYRLPDALAGLATVGSRVVVPVGGRKYYTGIVVRIHNDIPADGVALKEVSELVDNVPLVLPAQLDFWAWMSYYYMCTIGEVMRAALPSGLKLESESVVCLCPEVVFPETMRQQEIDLLAAIGESTGRSIKQLEKEFGQRNLLPLVRRLMDKGLVAIKENMAQRFRPKTETYIRLETTYLDESRLRELFEALKRAPKQAALLATYLDLSGTLTALHAADRPEPEGIAKKELLRQENTSEAALSALSAKGILIAYPHEVGRLGKRTKRQGTTLRELSPRQLEAAESIKSAFTTHGVCLLHGVTSSGKTEIYAHLIAEELAAGRQVLYLVPEIALTTQLTERLERLFGDKMVVYHSKFPDAERVEIWKKQAGESPYGLILGVRSSLFLPFRRLGLVIVDEEHESSYKQQDPAPRYHARDAAIMLARMAGAKVLLGTATPSIETYHHAMNGKYGLVELTQRYGDIFLPEIEVEDVRKLQREKMMDSPFSPRLLHEMKTALEKGEQIILFQNRRGYSPVLTCRTCGWTPRCHSCDVTLTLHQRDGRMVCHYCGASHPIPTQCPQCGGTHLRDIGYGTEKIEEAASRLFPDARIARLDLDTARTRMAYERVLHDFSQGRTDILVGTQMVTKGLDFEGVRVVGILNADQMLNLPDFRAYERAFQMMTQVAGRAGRRDKRGLVILQTCQPDLQVIGQVERGDYQGMFTAQMKERHAFLYPPEVRLILIYIKHRIESSAEQTARLLADILSPTFGNRMLGPEKPVIGRLQSQYIRTIMLKIDPQMSMAVPRDLLWTARMQAKQSESGRSATIFFDVDPL